MFNNTNFEKTYLAWENAAIQKYRDVDNAPKPEGNTFFNGIWRFFTLIRDSIASLFGGIFSKKVYREPSQSNIENLKGRATVTEKVSKDENQLFNDLINLQEEIRSFSLTSGLRNSEKKMKQYETFKGRLLGILEGLDKEYSQIIKDVLKEKEGTERHRINPSQSLNEAVRSVLLAHQANQRKGTESPIKLDETLQKLITDFSANDIRNDNLITKLNYIKKELGKDYYNEFFAKLDALKTRIESYSIIIDKNKENRLILAALKNMTVPSYEVSPVSFKVIKKINF